MLFPENITCLICGKDIDNPNFLCASCDSKFPQIHNSCSRCGCSLNSGKYCVRCKNNNFNFFANYAACCYNNFVKNVIYRFKNGDKYLHKPLGEKIVKKLKESNAKFDLIVSVPVTQKVYKKRGYNQSELLAKYITDITHTPYVNALTKTRETLFQKNCTKEQRKQNVENAFAVINVNAVKGKTILIADDIITTGATLDNASAALKKAGAAEVLCCTFAAVKTEIKFDYGFI